MIRSTQSIMIEIGGWEIEISIPLEFTAIPGEPQTRWEPGYAAEIEDIRFNDVEVANIIKKEILDLQAEEKIDPIVYDIHAVLGNLEEQIDKDDILHEELLIVAEQNAMDSLIDYYEMRRDEERGI